MVFNSNNQGIAKEINARLLLFTLNKKWMVHSYKLLVNRKIYSFSPSFYKRNDKSIHGKKSEKSQGTFSFSSNSVFIKYFCSTNQTHPIAFSSNIFAVHTQTLPRYKTKKCQKNTMKASILTLYSVSHVLTSTVGVKVTFGKSALMNLMVAT